MTQEKDTSRSTIQIEWWPTAAFLGGLVLLYIGERAIGDPARVRVGVDAAAGLAMAAGLAGRVRSATGARDPHHRRAEGWILLAMALVLGGIGLYFLFSLGREWLRSSLGKSFDRTDGVAAVLWPALVLLGALPLLAMQRALSAMTDGHGRAEHIEIRRVSYSAHSGATVGLVLIFCFAINYVASELNKKVDLARFRSTRPSPATIKIVQNLNRPMRAVIFLPSANEVREQIEPYFKDLSQKSARFTYEVVDHALSPQKARDLAATGNGLIVLGVPDEKNAAQMSQREILHVGTTLETAATALQTFDGDVQKRLLLLTRPGRIAYFTVGHGERGFDRFTLDLTKEDLRAPMSILQQILQGQGYEVRTLGVGQGLANKVPGDAGIVFIAGPTERFLAEEVNALRSYLEGGGHIFLMLDPMAEGPAADLQPLLKAVGVKFHAAVLCNDENYWPRTHQKSDFANIAAISFSSHASMSTLSRASGRVALVLPRSGWFERDGTAPPGVQLDFTIRSMPRTWEDANHNFTFDKEEKQQVFDLAVAAHRTVGDAKDKKEMRLAALGSIDAMSDLVLGHRPNLVLALDTIKWLMGDEAIAAEVAQEQDLPIVHTRAEDKAWFYLTVFLMPTLILIGGLLYIRRVRRRRAS